MNAAAVKDYAYDNHSAHAASHHEALSEMLDAHTQRRIDELVSLPGARCLEVAAGAGSIATWLADRVGPDGRVVATDLKPQRIADHPGLEVREHDITSGTPLGQYDLVHARLLLNHLVQRQVALRHMADALEPGGVLLTEDFVATPGEQLVAIGPEPARDALVGRFQQLHLGILADRGNERTWSHRAVSAFHEAGLVDVQAVVYGGSWRGGDPGCQLLLAIMGQLRERILALGMTEEELEQVREALVDPRLVLNGYLVYLTSGRKPGVATAAGTD